MLLDHINHLLIHLQKGIRPKKNRKKKKTLDRFSTKTIILFLGKQQSQLVSEDTQITVPVVTWWSSCDKISAFKWAEYVSCTNKGSNATGTVNRRIAYGI